MIMIEAGSTRCRLLDVLRLWLVLCVQQDAVFGLIETVQLWLHIAWWLPW
jgi:hypothetical protein